MQKLKYKLKSKNRKGFTLGQLPQVFLVIMLIGVILGATYITLDAFQNSTDNTSNAYTGIGYVITFLDNIASNLPTVGVIVFVVVLIGVIMYIRFKPRAKGGA